jgi:hypothetical protein
MVTIPHEILIRYTAASGPNQGTIIRTALANGNTINVFPNTDYDILVRVKGVQENQGCRVTLGRTDVIIYDKSKPGTGGELIFPISNLKNGHATEGYALGILVNYPGIPTGNAIISWGILTNPLTLGVSTLMGAFSWLWRIKEETQLVGSEGITFHVFDSSIPDYTMEELSNIRTQVEQEAARLESPLSPVRIGQAGEDFVKNITDFFGGVGSALAPYAPYLILGAVALIVGPTAVRSFISGGRD